MIGWQREEAAVENDRIEPERAEEDVRLYMAVGSCGDGMEGDAEGQWLDFFNLIKRKRRRGV